jgi:hypothetical protein
VPDAVFIPAEPSAAAAPVPEGAEWFVATDLARGPWDPRAQHGGAPAALLIRAFERQPGGDELILARVTYELLRPVPLGPLAVSAEIVRPGRRVQLLEGSLRTADGVEVVRARALRVHRADVGKDDAGVAQVDASAAGPPVAGPEDGRANDYPSSGERMFATDTMDIRYITGAFLELGPATAWFRLRYPLVAGEDPSPLQRLAAAADFGNGISTVVPWDSYVFINPDLTLYLEREPVGEWFLLEAHTRLARDGIAISESVISDERGRVGLASQALLVTRRASAT